MSKKYVPHLIPEEHRLLKNYFKGNVYGTSKSNSLFEVISWVIGISSFLFALRWIGHPVLMILLVILGYAVIPPGHKLLERKLKFRFTPKVKGFFVCVLLIFSLPLSFHYESIDEAIKLEEQEKKLLAQKWEQQQRDSLNHYIKKSQLEDAHQKYDEAIQSLKHAITFAYKTEDTSRINNQYGICLVNQASGLVSSAQYKAALPKLSFLIPNSSDSLKKNLLYKRALCFSKIDSIKQAVDDCNAAIKLGSVEAEKLHNKINPVKRRIIYYETLCCDGSSSTATGRGACSHHGGVCDWNSPVYQEYRKY